MSDWNAGIIDEFRANDGKVGGMFEGAPLVIVATTGAKSGQERLAPLMSRHEDGRTFVFASKAGAPTHPDWLHNIRANNAVQVEAPGDSYDATAIELGEPERTEIYTRQGEEWAQFAKYQEGTDRVIPVIELVRR